MHFAAPEVVGKFGSPINHTQMRQSIDIGRARSLKLSLTTEISGDFIQVVNVTKDLGVFMDYSFSPSIHCRQAASKAIRMLFVKSRPSDELPVSAFTPLHYNKMDRPHLEYAMQACSPALLPTPIVSSKYSG